MVSRINDSKVVVFVDNFPQQNLGGGEKFIIQLANALIEKGAQVGFAVQEDSGMATIARELTDTVFEIDFSALVPPVAARRISRWIQETFDSSEQICIQGTGFYTDFIATLASYNMPWRVIATIQTEIVHGGGGARDAVAGMSRDMIRTLIRPSIDAYLTVSHALKDQLVHDGVDSNDITVIPNSVPVESFCKRVEISSELDVFKGVPKGKRIGFLGRFEQVKRVDLLLTAFFKLAYLHGDAHLFLAGDGSLEQRLREQAKKSDFEARVHFTGFIEPVRFYKGIDVFCMPSDHEGMCTAVLEAQAAKVPIVATEVGGMKELVIDGKTGRTVKPNNRDELAKALDQSLSEDELNASKTAAYINNAYRYASTYYDTDTLEKSMIEFYDGVFSSKIK